MNHALARDSPSQASGLAPIVFSLGACGMSGRCPDRSYGAWSPVTRIATSLSEAAAWATSAALAHFAECRLVPEAELLFVIYP
jgi:hypothetical protein